MTNPIISLEQVSKTYQSGVSALKPTDLSIAKGEIFALLGPNGAGKTTLISLICGIVTLSDGRISVAGYDSVKHYRQARRHIGLVPQELAISAFETPLDTLRFSRGLFGKARDDAYLQQVLRSLSLWDKRNSPIMTLSGGMKRRVLIAKALAHQPSVLFLDEPTAGVDVELRRDLWQLVKKLREDGTTIILTTHYIEEAEAMADRIGVINKGELILVDDKLALMQKLGKKRLSLHLQEPLQTLPEGLQPFTLELSDQGHRLHYTYDTQQEHTGIGDLLKRLDEHHIEIKDLQTKQSSLEEIFVSLVQEPQ